jgi:general secretion pathway protein F
MPLYRYKAVNGAGDVVEGTMDAPTQSAAVRQLNRTGLVPIRADEARSSLWSRPISLNFGRRRGPSLVQLAMFTRELAMLLDAGLPLDRALQATLDLGSRQSGWRVDRAIERVRGGATLAHALAAVEGFPEFYVGMIEAGEASGNLPAVLNNLTDYLESMARLRESLTSALIYPALVAVTCLGSLAIFVGFVLPQFEGILREAGVAVPLGVSILLGSTQFVGNWWWLLLILAAALWLLWRRQIKQPETRRAVHRLILHLPLIGELVRKTIASRFTRTLGLLLQNGVTLSAALTIARATLANLVMRDAIDGVALSVREGKGFAEPLARSGALPELAAQLIKVGEETSRLAEILTKVADIYDWEMRRSLDRLLAFLVPGLTIAMGVIVAAVVGSILTAMFSIYDIAM